MRAALHPKPANQTRHRLGLLACVAVLFSCANDWAVGAPTPATPPVANVPLNALQFNGQLAQGVTIMEPAATSPFNVSTALTIEAWVNVSAWSKRYQAIVTKGDAWGLVRADNTSKIAFRTEVGSAIGQTDVYDDLVSADDLPLGSWQHVVAVFTRNKKQLFINGVLSAETFYTGPLVPSTFPVVIGGQANSDRTFEGSIDSVRLWSVERTIEQITRRNVEYLRGSEPGLLAEWRFNEAGGTDALDSAPGGYRGVLQAGKLDGGGAGTPPLRVAGLLLNLPVIDDLALFFNNPPSEVIVDNAAPGGVTVTGSWTAATTTVGFFGTNYLDDGNTAKGTKSVRFTPTLARGGNYDVYLWWTAAANRASNVPVDILHAGGASTFVINQRTGGGAWVKVNTTPLAMNAGISASVLVRTTGTDGLVVADAARFVALGQPQYAQVTPVPSTALDFSTAMTAEAWILPTELPSSGSVAVISKGAGAWEVRYHATGKISFVTAGVETTVPGGDLTELISNTRVEPGIWTHVAVVWDGAAKMEYLYLNGVLDVSVPAQGSIGTNALPPLFGAQPIAGPAQARSYSGTIEEVRLWRVVRSPQELQASYLLRINGSEPGLAGAWSFNEATGLTAADRSPSGFAATLSTNMSSFNRVDGLALGDPLLASYTIAFNGTNQAAVVADDAALSGFTSLTIETWIKPEQAPGAEFMDIVMKGASGYGLALDRDLHLRFLVDASPTNALKSTGVVPLGVWSHVAVVVDGVARRTTFYINGLAAGTVNSAVITSSPGALAFGRHGGSATTNFFKGNIDEVRIWNTARTQAEISLLAFSELPAGGNTGLVGHWSFTEGGGSTVADSAGGRTATLLNTTNASWRTGPVFPQAPTLPPGLNLTLNPKAAGLWVGQVALKKVNEVQKAVGGVAAAVSPTGDSASIRIILHVDAAGKVRLLKDVIVMQTQPTGTPLPPAKPVLVTDPTQISNYQGVVMRNGKLVGLRYGTAAFDFDGLDATMIGGIGAGVACAGRIDLDKDAATNPYRHKFHPDHQHGFDIIRVFSLQFGGVTGDPLAAAPGYGVDRISGIYRESIAGLHKITLKTEGTVILNRISTVATLNTP